MLYSRKQKCDTRFDIRKQKNKAHIRLKYPEQKDNKDSTD